MELVSSIVVKKRKENIFGFHDELLLFCVDLGVGSQFIHIQFQIVQYLCLQPRSEGLNIET